MWIWIRDGMDNIIHTNVEKIFHWCMKAQYLICFCIICLFNSERSHFVMNNIYEILKCFESCYNWEYIITAVWFLAFPGMLSVLWGFIVNYNHRVCHTSMHHPFLTKDNESAHQAININVTAYLGHVIYGVNKRRQPHLHGLAVLSCFSFFPYVASATYLSEFTDGVKFKP